MRTFKYQNSHRNSLWNLVADFPSAQVGMIFLQNSHNSAINVQKRHGKTFVRNSLRPGKIYPFGSSRASRRLAQRELERAGRANELMELERAWRANVELDLSLSASLSSRSTMARASKCRCRKLYTYVFVRVHVYLQSEHARHLMYIPI